MVALVQEQFRNSKNFQAGHANFGRSNRSFRQCTDGKRFSSNPVHLPSQRFQNGETWHTASFSHRRLCEILSSDNFCLAAGAWRLASLEYTRSRGTTSH